jgi:hypothetical protein
MANQQAQESAAHILVQDRQEESAADLISEGAVLVAVALPAEEGWLEVSEGVVLVAVVVPLVAPLVVDLPFVVVVVPVVAVVVPFVRVERLVVVLALVDRLVAVVIHHEQPSELEQYPVVVPWLLAAGGNLPVGVSKTRFVSRGS